jgi:hypothetical protein
VARETEVVYTHVFPRLRADTRARSNWFYSMAMQELVAEEYGVVYGMASPLPPRP